MPGVPTPPGAISDAPAGLVRAVPALRRARQLDIEFEGANHYPFTDYPSLILARDRLAGRDQGGRYWLGHENGEQHSKDGFDAGQEEATGRKPEFPLSRYTTPINIEPENFDWVDVEPGVKVKELGRFTEHQTRIAMLRLEGAATYQLPAPGQTTMFFVTSGSGAAGGQEIGERDSMLLQRGESAAVSTTAEVELFILGFPMQDELRAIKASTEASSEAQQAATVSV